MTPQVLVSRRRRPALILAAFALMPIAVAAVAPHDGAKGWLIILFLAAITALVTAPITMMLVRPPQLRMDAMGLLYQPAFGAPLSFNWREVRFHTWRGRRGGSGVAYRLAPDRRPRGPASWLNRMQGHDGFLAGAWEIPPEQVVWLLQSYQPEDAREGW